MKNTFAILTLLAVTAVSAIAQKQTTGQNDWPQWRGPNRDGTTTAAVAWPDSLDTSVMRKSWSVPLGPSYSGPVVVGGKVFTTETAGEKSERVTAFDRKSGRKIWSTTWEGAMKVPFFAAGNGSWIRATPASDGRSLIVAGMRDVLVSLDVETGAQNWGLDFVKELKSPLPSFGMVCSPLIDGDFVYVQAGAGFCKVDKNTGAIVWRTAEDKGGMYGSAFSSPVKARLAGKDVFLVQARESLRVIDAATANVDWVQPIKAFRGMNILTPVVHNDSIFTSAYGGKTIVFDAALTDGRIALKERWGEKHQGYMSTPVIIDGTAYHHLRNQRFIALDLATGRELWNQSNRFGKYWSMVANGNQILALDQNGTLRLLQADREKYRELDSRKVGDDTWAHVAVSGGQIFIRELNSLTVYDWPNSINITRNTD